MSEIEKAKKPKKGNKGKKSKKAKVEKTAKAEGGEAEVLERVMNSIEMAGASLDFFEKEDEATAVEEEQILGEAHSEQPLEALSEDAEVIEDSDEAEDSMEAAAQTDDALETDAIDDEEAKLEALSEEGEEIEAASDEEGSQEETLEASADSSDDDEEQTELDGIEDENLEFIDQEQAYSVIESLLFSSDRPMGLGIFKQVFKGTTFKGKDIKKALEDMQSVYAERARGVTLEEINGGWQLRTKVDNMDFLRKLAKARPFKLSGPALEVMAIVAYKQPIVKSEVDDIRGVESGHLLRALMEKGLVNFQGKSELPGKPMQYGSTRKFLEIFGLRNLRELPSLDEIDQLLPDGIGIEEESETLSDVTDKMSEEYAGNYSEGEDELLKIEGTLEGIDTSSEFFEEEKRRQKEKRDRDRARDLREALDVGEDVDEKDVKWLERYDARLAEEAAQKEAEEAAAALAAEQGEAEGEESSTISAEATEVEEQSATEVLAAADVASLSDELSALSQEQEPLVSEEVMAADDALEQDEAGEMTPEGDETADSSYDPFDDEESFKSE